MPNRVAYLKPAAPAVKPQRVDDGFYKRAKWARVRLRKLRENPLCQSCEAKGLTVPATQVHHIRELRQRPDLAYDMENLQSLCAQCHGSMRLGTHVNKD